jgi:hypothetical protein
MAAFDRALRPALKTLFPEKTSVFLSWRGSPDLRARIERLAAKSTEGQLTKEERSEYEAYVRANKFLAILRRQARELAAKTS